MENLTQLAESMRQASVLLSDEDPGDSSRQGSGFLAVVALGVIGAGKSAVLNSLIGHPVLPTGENGATRVPIVIDMDRDEELNSKQLVLQVENKLQQVSASTIRRSLQEKLTSASVSERGRFDDINLKLRSSTAPPLRMVDLPGVDQRGFDESMINKFTDQSDGILLVVVPASQASEISSSRALRLAHDLDPDASRTVGVISKIDQAASDPRSLAAVQALLVGQGPSITQDVPWVALIGQSASIATAHSSSSGGDNSLDTAWKAETENLKSILSSAPQSKLGRNALVDTLSKQIRKRLKIRLPSILSGLEDRTQEVEEELVRLGESLVQTSEGTRAIALELCREFEDKFLQHINTGEGGSWKVVASFEGALPGRIKQLPLNDLFDLNNVKKIVLEADGYQPYLISPEKGLRALVRKVLELAKEPARQCVDEVHRILVDIVSSAASATSGLGRYPPFKREIVAIASAALDEYRSESRKMVIALVDMERAFIPPQHFIRLVQRRIDRQRREDQLKQKSSKKPQEAEQSITNRSATPPPRSEGSLKSMKEKGSSDKETKEMSSLQTAGSAGELTAGYLYKKSSKTNAWKKRWFVFSEKTGKLGYTKSSDEKLFRGVITLDECIIEECSEGDLSEEAAPPAKSKSSKRGSVQEPIENLCFKVSNKVSYKTVVKAHHSIILKADTMIDKKEWMNKLQSKGQGSKNSTSLRGSSNDSAPATTMKTSLSDGSLDTVLRRPIDPDEDLKMMAQEVRDYVEAVLNSLAANIPKAVVFCQVERAKDAMLNQLYSSISAKPFEVIQELLQEDQDVKRQRERVRRKASLLSRLTKQLSIHEARTITSGWSANGGASGSEDWQSTFESGNDGYNDYPDENTTNGYHTSSNGGYSQRFGDPQQNGDNGMSRRTPSRLPPAPPSSSGFSMFRF
ncbi:hypothetical protein KP509_12G002200 [Ceratopteris richardii]|uniref:dynamin GTPase n=1 Tax=Ceratopteris richardii TaxID=49495 RepID=A0A8T2TI38_CERRI|nr:hypothetical protein KP509_12G002200 [Ceratopteris richardii]KAH7422291.1 hypothetical protein KP509_12G002200 [Ceratopteris richardii]KAH7422292.1 hypothetical protein KP509_12G002200 [Ceratopteris richardii]KAH7422293.1 hypothetical protein KP509_12G002200 [Ceratopteris richardii]